MTICNLPVPAPAAAPAAGSEPVVLAFLLCFEKQGGASMIDPQTYLYYIRSGRASRRSDSWVAYDDDVEALIAQDFRRLWATGSSTTCRSRRTTTRSRTASSARSIVFNMEERQRVRIVDYEGSRRSTSPPSRSG